MQLPYSRTNTLADSWRVEGLSSDHVRLLNEATYAGYMIEQTRQSRMSRLIGWKTTQQIIALHRHDAAARDGGVPRMWLSRWKKSLKRQTTNCDTIRCRFAHAGGSR